MARTARILLTVALLGGIPVLPAARAQAPALTAAPAPAPQPASAAPASAVPSSSAETGANLPAALPGAPAPAGTGGAEPAFLRTLPRPPDQPRSLFEPALPPGPPPPDLERPYFQLDPILDPALWAQPGWFFNVEFDVIHPHIERRLANNVGSGFDTVPTATRNVNVALPGPKMDWTVAPRFELGYRLPSGFGAFSASDRFFNTQGQSAVVGPNGPGKVTGRLRTNYADFDYSSHEYTPWADTWMMWRLGMRVAFADIDSNFYNPLAAAVAGNGVRNALQNTYDRGIGPHFGVMLNHRIADTGFSLVGKIDEGNVFSRESQVFAASTTTPAGHSSRGAVESRFWQMIAILNFQVGLAWQPPSNPNFRLYMGYVYEAWFDTEENSNSSSGLGAGKGMFTNQGVVFQGGWKF